MIYNDEKVNDIYNTIDDIKQSQNATLNNYNNILDYISNKQDNSRDEIYEYFKNNGIEDSENVYNHLINSGYDDNQIRDIMYNDYDIDIMENVKDYYDLGKRALYGESPKTMLGDNYKYYLDEDIIGKDLKTDIDDLYFNQKIEENPNFDYDLIDESSDDYQSFKQEIIDEFIDGISDDDIDYYFDYDKLGYDLSINDYYYDENTSVASRNN